MNYGIIGFSGRMGQEIHKLFQEKNYNLVFSYDENGEKFISKPDILIDFSLPNVLNKTIEYALKFNVPIVIGTTGYSDEELKKIKELSSKIPVFQSYNFSIGIQLLLKCIDLVKKFTNDWDIEIEETHHRFKKDKPSGTAIMLKNRLNKEVNISSLRLGNVVGDHKVIFASLGEIVTLQHTAISRRTFAEGVLMASEFLIDQTVGFYNFSDIIK